MKIHSALDAERGGALLKWRPFGAGIRSRFEPNRESGIKSLPPVT